MIKDNREKAVRLRQKAEELLKLRPSKSDSIIHENEMLRLLHELEVRQIELELQNEELILAEKALLEAQWKFQALFDKGPIGVAYHEMIYNTFGEPIDYHFIDANKSYIELTGVDPRGKTARTAFPGIENEPFKWIETYNRVAVTGVSIRFEQYFQLNNRWYDCVAYQYKPNHFVTAFIEISKHKRAEEKLFNERLLLRTVIDNIPDAIYTKDLNLRKTLANSTEVSYMGAKSEEEVLGNDDFAFYPKELAESFFADDQSVIQTGVPVINREEYIPDDNGQKRYILSTKLPLKDKDNHIIGLVGIGRDITKNKKSEEALKESEEKFAKVFRDAPVLIAITDITDSTYLDVNEQALQVSGFSREELVGHTAAEIGWIGAEDSAKLIQETRNHGQIAGIEMVFHTKNGRKLYGLVKGEQMTIGGRSCLLTVTVDITERKHAEEQLELLSRAIEQSPVTVVITNREGNIEYINPKFTETTGYSLEEVKGQNPRILKSGKLPKEFYQELWSTILSGNDWHGEFHNQKKNGESYWESSVISPIINSLGKISYFIAVKEDITEKKEMLANLINAKEQAEESDRLKSAFLANMSHEIRTPMNGILGFAGLLKEPRLSGEEQQEYISIIEKSGARMLSIINDIISISKVESGQIEVTISGTNINGQIEYIYTFFKPEALKNGIQLFFKTPLPANEAIIKTDKEKVYAILTNLVKNALKFTREGSIEFGYIKKDQYLEFFVKDTGAGIPEEQQEFIFERFRQGNELLSRNYEGAGLGLSISKAYVEMLGGKIRVESKSGKGSTFYFTLPYKVEPEEKKAIENIVEDSLDDNRIKNLKILIAEDDEASAMLISMIIKDFGSKILISRTGTEAIQTCQNHPDIDLVLMDIKMPEMDGYEASRQIRQFNKEVIIIVQTAYALTGDHEKAIEAGCNDYIAKPIQKDQLIVLIQKYFNK